MNWRPLPQSGDPLSIIRRLIAQINEWAQDKDRFERKVSTPSDFTSSGASVALRTGIAIESSRVGNEAGGTLNPLDVTGSLIPSFHNTYDIGMPSPNKRWRDAYLGRNLDMDGSLDVAGSAIVAGSFAAGSISGVSISVSSGLSSADITCNHLQVLVGATIAGLTVTGQLATSTLQSGGASFSANVLISGAATVSGRVTAGGLSVSDNSNFAAVGISFAGTTLAPITTLTGAIGFAARRFATVFGGTANFVSGIVSGGTMTVSGRLTANDRLINPGGAFLTGGATVSGELRADSIFPSADGAQFGQGPPFFSVAGSFRWGDFWTVGTLFTHKGADINGETLSIPSTSSGTSTGNYFDISGSTRITGITFADSTFAPQDGAFLFFQTDNTPAFTNQSTGLQLMGGVTYHAQPGDHIGFITAGNYEWREMFRSVRANLGHLTYFSQTADKTVTGVSTETSMFGTGIGTSTIPANFFGIGRTLRITANGIYGRSSGTNGVVTFRLKMGTTTLTTWDSIDLAGSSFLPGAWQVQEHITCRSIGTAGTVQPWGVLYDSNVSGSISYGRTGTATIVGTAGAHALDLTAQFAGDDTTNSNSIACQQLIVEALA